MKSIVLSFFVLISLSFGASAQFSGAYDPMNWIIQNNYTTPTPNTGTVNTGGAPTTIILNGSDDDPNVLTDVDVDFIIYAPTSGDWSFHWEFNSNDASAEWDEAYVIVNGSPQLLTDNTQFGDVNQDGDFFGNVAAAGEMIGFRLRSRDNTGGNATLTITSFFSPGSVLPVTLSLFNAKQSGEQVKLDWTTQSESNSDRFEVERSTNGKDFKLISTVKAAGNSTLTQNYSAIDNNPENGNNYYRLRQVDLDGKFTYSMIKTLKWSALSLIKVYPNPVRNMVTLRFTPERTETTSITMFDGAGKTIQRRNIAAVAGSNMVTEWNVEALAPGIYFFRVNSLTTPLRFVKQ